MRIPKPSPAMVVATIALVAAAAGGGYAAGEQVTGKQIKNQSITAADIAPNAINARHIRPNAVGSGEIKNGAVRFGGLPGRATRGRRGFAKTGGNILAAAPDFELTKYIVLVNNDTGTPVRIQAAAICI